MTDPAAELAGMGGGINGPDMPPIEPTPRERLVHAAQLVDRTPLSPELETASDTLFNSPVAGEELAGQLEDVTNQLKETLDPTQRPMVDDFQNQVRTEKIKKEDILAGLRDYKNQVAQSGTLSPEQMERANEILASLQNEDPTTETGFSSIKNKLGQFSGIFKTAGALFIGVMGLLIFKGIQAAKGDLAPAR